MEGGQNCQSLDADDIVARYDVVEIVGEQFTRDIEFQELKAIEIDRQHTQHALQLTESTRKVMLPGNLQYVRMCKALDDKRLLLIYGRSDEMPFRDTLESHGIQIHAVHTVKVPKYSPCTKEQFKSWSAFWPLKYLKPGLTPVKITPATKEKMISMIAQVLRDSSENEGGCVCYITFKDRIIAKSVDERRENILNHAALLAVRKVADMQRRGPNLMSNSKRRYTGEKSDSEGPGDAFTDVEIPDYLCTQCEVFMSHEPCCMCAMALLHSRVASVTYFYPNPSIGGLGSVHSLHNTRQLNHHFRAFRVKQK
ncbi:hypothetical protein BgAZ_404010 [Babesia gibsoni]|uniref:CMP/dCMP-type deaminase domain-containing protein n=1 Tax=Babesia gibsoni TaxID=33632 RepID=A0AAD8LNL3_BABGI|nr:hypothetical protein BgAZ_404010 [Babesia gibsoni]